MTQVPARTLNQWKLKYRFGDYGIIAKATGISRPTIIKAFKGEAQDILIKVINKYYEQ
jgi:hypothetical protein